MKELANTSDILSSYLKNYHGIRKDLYFCNWERGTKFSTTNKAESRLEGHGFYSHITLSQTHCFSRLNP